MSLAARFKKATLIFIGQGMSSFGVKTCGDYLYSGHTCTLVLATHFINECKLRTGSDVLRTFLLTRVVRRSLPDLQAHFSNPIVIRK